MNRAKLVLICFLFLMLQGCATQSNTAATIASNDEFKIVKPKHSDTYESLAQEHLGKAGYSSILKRYNPSLPANQLDYVAVPKVPLNKSGVFINGYQHVTILCYHQFTRDKKGRSKMVVPEHEFKAQMSYLYENGYNVIPLSDVGLFIRGKKELPEKSVVITIDDGYKSYMDIALPILREYDYPSTMFVYPEFVGAGVALKWADVKALHQNPLVDIQSHSRTHDSLHQKPNGESMDAYLTRLNFEVVEAEQIIAKRTGNVIKQFAYPYGNSSPTVIKMLQENEYDLAVTVERGGNPAFSAPYLLNRTMIYGGDSLKSFKRSLDTFVTMDLK